jgi:outer membrane biosynthesis protein TonB
MPWVWLARVIALSAVVALALWVHQQLDNPAQLPSVQHIALVSPTTPPSPPPPPAVENEPKPLPPTPAAEAASNTFEAVSAPASSVAGAAPGRSGGGPALGPIGLDTQGEGAGDSFGLSGRPGGREVTTIGHIGDGEGDGGGGGGSGSGQRRLSARFNGMAYAVKLKQALEAAFNARNDLQGLHFHAVVDVWIGPDGKISRVTMVDTSGVADMDAQIESVLKATTVAPPAANMPQPVRLAVNAKSVTPSVQPPAESGPRP